MRSAMLQDLVFSLARSSLKPKARQITPAILGKAEVKGSIPFGSTSILLN